MKKLLSVAAASAAIIAAPAVASPVSDEFDINANVADTCTMENINDIDLGTLSINTTAGPAALLINGPSAEETGDFWLSCNETNRMSLVPANGVLVNQDRSLQPGDDAGFKDTINYSVRARNYRSGFGALFNPLYNSITGPLFQNLSRGAIHREVTIDALVTAVENLDGRPLAGNYQDTITVTVTII
ncbi:MAG: hypothetical protein AAGE05_05385 [Pseudomonadota bacterium]